MNAAGNVIAAAVPAIAPIQGIQASPPPAKCASRILISSIAWNYYNDTGREATQNNMHFSNILRDFNVEWESISTLARQVPAKVPGLSK